MMEKFSTQPSFGRAERIIGLSHGGRAQKKRWARRAQRHAWNAWLKKGGEGPLPKYRRLTAREV